MRTLVCQDKDRKIICQLLLELKCTQQWENNLSSVKIDLGSGKERHVKTPSSLLSQAHHHSVTPNTTIFPPFWYYFPHISPLLQRGVSMVFSPFRNTHL